MNCCSPSGNCKDIALKNAVRKASLPCQSVVSSCRTSKRKCLGLTATPSGVELMLIVAPCCRFVFVGTRDIGYFFISLGSVTPDLYEQEGGKRKYQTLCHQMTSCQKPDSGQKKGRHQASQGHTVGWCRRLQNGTGFSVTRSSRLPGLPGRK